MGFVRRFWKWIAAIGVTAAVATPLALSSGGSVDVLVGSTPTPTPTATPTPGPDEANLWVNTTAGGSPSRCSPACAYDSGDAYGSIDAAWDAATAGDTIGVNTNSGYGSQTISGTKASETTILANGSTFDGLSVSATNLTIEDFTVDGNTVGITGDDVEFHDANLHGLETDLQINADRFVWDGGEFGFEGWDPADRNFCTGSLEPIEMNGAEDPVMRNVDLWHVERLDDGTNQCDHLEYIRIDSGGSGATFDSVFHHDEGLEESNTATIFLTNPSNGGSYDGLTILNSYWGDNDADSGVFGIHENVDSCTNWTIAYNTYRTLPYVPSTAGGGACGTTTGTVWVGNLGPYTSFHPCTGTHIKNRWQHNVAGSCGTDVWTTGPAFGVGNLGFSTTTGLLNSGSVALDNGETTYCASAIGNVDRLGRARSGTCDNGSAEGVG